MKIEIKKENNKSIKLLRNYSNYESKNQKGNHIFKIEFKLKNETKLQKKDSIKIKKNTKNCEKFQPSRI